MWEKADFAYRRAQCKRLAPLYKFRKYNTGQKTIILHIFNFQMMKSSSLNQFARRMSSTPNQSSKSYCMNLVKKRDYEKFLATLLLPRRSRRAAFAVRAFNVEIATIRESVSQLTLGQMRMQFWRDSVRSESAAADHHPVVKELNLSVKALKLSKEPLLRIINARESRLKEDPFKSLDEIDEYNKETFGNVNRIISETLLTKENPAVNGHLRHATMQLGQAEGLVTLLRAIPYHKANNRTVLPAELMSWAGDDLPLAVETIAAKCQERLLNCRFRKKYLGMSERATLLPAVAVDSFLGQLHLAKCDILHKSLQRSVPSLPFLLLKHRMLNKY